MKVKKGKLKMTNFFNMIDKLEPGKYSIMERYPSGMVFNRFDFNIKESKKGKHPIVRKIYDKAMLPACPYSEEE